MLGLRGVASSERWLAIQKPNTSHQFDIMISYHSRHLLSWLGLSIANCFVHVNIVVAAIVITTAQNLDKKTLPFMARLALLVSPKWNRYLLSGSIWFCLGARRDGVESSCKSLSHGFKGLKSHYETFIPNDLSVLKQKDLFPYPFRRDWFRPKSQSCDLHLATRESRRLKEYLEGFKWLQLRPRWRVDLLDSLRRVQGAEAGAATVYGSIG